MLPWWPKEATINLASEETLTLAGSSRYRWRNHLVMGGGIISLQVAASVGISTWHSKAMANVKPKRSNTARLANGAATFTRIRNSFTTFTGRPRSS